MGQQVFEVEIEYETGDSFNTYQRVETLGTSFTSIEEAEEMLDLIKGHYHAYEDSNGWNSRKRLRWEDIKEELWASKGSHEDSWEYRIAWKDSHIDAFWCGYFERLLSASIVKPQLRRDEY